MIQRMDDPDISFDLQLSGRVFSQAKGDHLDRIKHEMRVLEAENQQLRNQLKFIRSNPQQLIEEFKSKLMKRIAEMKQENKGIQELIEKSKIPGYAEMTKKKQSYLTETPGKKIKKQYKQEDEDMDFERRNPFSSVEMSEKCEVSTCQNYPIQMMAQNPLRQLEPLQDNQLRLRAQITSQLLQVIDQTSQIVEEVGKVSGQASRQNQQSMQSMRQNSRRLEEISKYKQKLLHLLKKLKSRENCQQQIVREYQIMYDQTLRKFQEATSLLNELSSIKTDQNLDDLYAEVLQLEERLTYINEQLQKVDEVQWLKDIQAELLHALKRLSIAPPPETKPLPNQTASEVLRQRIDALAQILIECAACHRADQKQKIVLLKLYYDEQKENNKKIIKALQNKEQGLSKKLIDIQMNN